MKPIPFFDYPSIYIKHSDQLNKIFRDVASSGSFIMQKELSIFESELASYVNMKHALGVANATDGLQLLLKAGGVGAGDEVIFCSHTMVATASAIAFTGATPVPVDVGEDHLIDCESVLRNITDKTVAIIPTQLNGRICDMDRMMDIADRYGLDIYEDSAQALGAKYNGLAAGSFGKGGCISFYPAKNLGCLGDGGAILTNNTDIYEKVKLLRDHGRGAGGEVMCWGFNSRLDNIQAAFLSYFLKDYDNVVAHRRGLAKRYVDNLSSLDEVRLPQWSDVGSKYFDVYQNFEIQCERRDSLKTYLSKKSIGSLVQWGGKAVHQFRNLGLNRDLPFTDSFMTRILMLPLNLSVTHEDVDLVCDHVKSFYKGHCHD